MSTESFVARLIAVALCTPASLLCQELSDSARQRADSIAIAQALVQLQADSIAAAQRARAAAESLLVAPVLLGPEAPALSEQTRELLRAKAWLLYLNPRARLRIVVHRPSQFVTLPPQVARAHGDSVRAFLQARGVDLSRVSVTERQGSESTSNAVFFEREGDLNVVTIPSTTAAPPEGKWVGRLLGPDRWEVQRWGTVRIFYATNRERTASNRPEAFYAGTRTPDGAMEFGRVEVTVPRIHRPGRVERPVWYKLERSTDPNKHITVKLVQPLGEGATYDSVRSVLAASARKETLVFIHGYNVSFADAAMRTAQMTYDLGFDGAPILYSWPSRASLFRYAADRENSEFSAAHLATFLDSVVAITGSKRVHIIAHSMGNRALTLALERMALQGGRDTLINNMVLAAADVDAARFEQQLAPVIRPLARRVTIYMSGQDKALRVSRALSTNLRLGEATSPMLVVNGTETIDASSISVDLLGHGYIGSSEAVIDDLALLINEEKPPPRTRLRANQTPSGATYWVLP